jgi:hypothetical protein
MSAPEPMMPEEMQELVRLMAKMPARRYWLWDGNEFVRDPADVEFEAAFNAALDEVFGPAEKETDAVGDAVTDESSAQRLIAPNVRGRP